MSHIAFQEDKSCRNDSMIASTSYLSSTSNLHWLRLRVRVRVPSTTYLLSRDNFLESYKGLLSRISQSLGNNSISLITSKTYNNNYFQNTNNKLNKAEIATGRPMSYEKKIWRKMWRACFRYSWRKMVAAAQDTAGWKQEVCGLFHLELQCISHSQQNKKKQSWFFASYDRPIRPRN